MPPTRTPSHVLAETPKCEAADAHHGQLPRGVTDSIPWYRPFFWSPTTDVEAQDALRKTLELVGCVATTPLLRRRSSHSAAAPVLAPSRVAQRARELRSAADAAQSLFPSNHPLSRAQVSCNLHAHTHSLSGGL